jgi:ClpP class serine protease
MHFSVVDIFWVFLMLSMLQPLIRQRALEASRIRLMRKIEQKRGSRLILLVHRQETMAILGFPIFRYINIQDAEEVIRAIRLTDPAVPLDLVLHTPGGLVLASLQIAHAIQDRPGKVTVFVPHYAMSGGTLIALAADEIVMGSQAVLGPVDPQLGEFPAASLVKILRNKKIDEIDDRTLILADVAEKALNQIRVDVVGLLRDKMPEDKAEMLADMLSQGTWTHDRPIIATEAKQMGLPISTEMPPEFYDLMSLFPQPVQSRPSVSYVPLPYGPKERPARGTSSGA